MTEEAFAEKYLSRLNPQQREAARTVEGAVLLLAVPGSGKTTVLVTRLGYMVCCRGVEPGCILTMTYTVAATREMRQRFELLFGGRYAQAMEFRTINGLSAKIIEYYGRNYGRRQPFALLDKETELSRLVGELYQKITQEYAGASTIKDIRTGITYIKNMMLEEEEIEHLDVGVRQLPEIYRAYCAELKRRELMDYDDQMAYALAILNSCPPVLAFFQEQYRYICVDESQDTSKIQHAIIRLLARKYGNIFMVGDEDQSIYGFRAAYPEALMNFEQDYAPARVLLIEQNYRSTQEIVEAAGRFVAQNRFRHPKTMQPTRGPGRPVQVIEALSREAQYKYLLTEAQSCREETAVLFRNNDSALPLIDRLERSGIPYSCRSFESVFFSHRVVCDITDIFHLAFDPCDREAFGRVYYKFGSPLKKEAARYACEQSRRSGRPVLEELLRFSEIGRSARDNVIHLLAVLPVVAQSSAVEALRLVRDETGYGKYMAANRLDSGKLETLCLLGANESGPKELLRRLGELREILQNHVNADGLMTLSTIHSSKGLEYSRVFLLDVFDGILPAEALPDPESPQAVQAYEEDRRLYYVGMTRAKNELLLFSCRDTPSAFTREVSRSLPREIFEETSALEAFQAPLCGRTYRHRERGRGVVLAQGGDTVLVEYEDGGLQRLTLAELWAQREKTVRYVPAPEKKGEPRRPGQGKHIPGEKEIKSLLEKAVAGQAVTHSKFGRGVISGSDGHYVTIRFDSLTEEKKFDLVRIVENGSLWF